MGSGQTGATEHERLDDTVVDDEPETVEPETVIDTELRRALRSGLALIGVVLVALFVQKSDGNTSVETLLILLMATVGCLMALAAGVIGFRNRHRKAEHLIRVILANKTMRYLAGSAGLLLLVASLQLIDRSTGDSKMPLGRGGSATDANGISLRNPRIAPGPATTRFAVTVVNIKSAPIVADQAEFTLSNLDVSCEDERVSGVHHLEPNRLFSEGYELTQRELELHVGQGAATALGTRGPLKGHSVKASIVWSSYCSGWLFRVTLPVTMSLAPHQTTPLYLDIRNAIRVVSKIRTWGPTGNAPKVNTGQHKVDVKGLAEDEALTLRVRIRFGQQDWSCVSRPSNTALQLNALAGELVDC